MPPVELDTITRIPTEAAHNLKDASYEPVVTRSNTTVPLIDSNIDDVNTPSATVVTSDDITVNPIEPTNEVEAYVGGIVDEIASYTLVQTALKTVDFTLDIVEKFVAVSLPSTTKYVQGVRRYLRAVRHAGRRHAGHTGGTFNKKTRSLRDLPSRRRKAMRQASITGYFADLFQLHFILNFLGLELTVADAKTKKTKKTSGHVSDDEESTVYKLMKEYDSQDDEDYVPSDSSVDSLEFESDCSDEETTAEQLNKEYVDKDDQDYVPEAASEDSAENIEYNSEAEVSAEESQEDAAEEAEDSQDAEAVEETEGRKESTSSVESTSEETTVDKLMKDSEDEQEDEDYVPEEVAEDSCEYNSDEEAIKEVIEEAVEILEEIEDVIEEAIEDVIEVIEEEVTQDSDDDVEDVAGETPLDTETVHEEVTQESDDDVEDAEDSQEDSQEMEEAVKEAEIVNVAEIVNEAEISQESSQDEEAEIVMVNVADISQESSQEVDEEAEIVMVDEIES